MEKRGGGGGGEGRKKEEEEEEEFRVAEFRKFPRMNRSENQKRTKEKWSKDRKRDDNDTNERPSSVFRHPGRRASRVETIYRFV